MRCDSAALRARREARVGAIVVSEKSREPSSSRSRGILGRPSRREGVRSASALCTFIVGADCFHAKLHHDATSAKSCHKTHPHNSIFGCVVPRSSNSGRRSLNRLRVVWRRDRLQRSALRLASGATSRADAMQSHRIASRCDCCKPVSQNAPP